MGKYSGFDRIEKDAYMTIDQRAVVPLVMYLGAGVKYYEPCVGSGCLVKLLNNLVCVGSSDTEKDARNTTYPTKNTDCFITNPPWSRDLLHPIIDNLRTQLPTWLLFDADWMHTKQASPYLLYCKTILSVGRLKWIPGTNQTGKENCAWYLFVDHETETKFVSR